MATTLTLYAIVAPLTRHHLVVACSSYSGSGFGLYEHRDALPDNASEEQRANAALRDATIASLLAKAEQAISCDAEFQAAIADVQVGNKAIKDLSPKLQFFALAPNVALVEDVDLPEDHALWDLVGRPVALTASVSDAILSAIKASGQPVDISKITHFLAAHYGATILIGHA